MNPVHQISRLLHDLQVLGKTAPRSDSFGASQGELILNAFERNTLYRSGAVYFRDRDGALRLVAKSEGIEAPASIAGRVPQQVLEDRLNQAELDALAWTAELHPRPQALLPIRDRREEYGLVGLVRSDEPGSVDSDALMLGAVSTYLSALFLNQKMVSEVREGEFQLKYRLWELESLYDIGLSIASTLDLDRLADEILFRTISLLNARRAALFLRRDHRFVLSRSFGDVRSEFLDEEIPGDQFSTLAADGQPIRMDSSADCIFPSCESFVAMPIRSSGGVIGVLAAADRENREGGVGPFEPNDLRVLSLFANQVAIALENARLHQEALIKQAMERELELAATIQQDILPRGLPSVPGCTIDAFSRPARQLGGDYYTFFEREGTLTFCVADVSGKSVPAAVLVSALHAALQLLMDEGRGLGDIATELNRHIHHWSSENKFITMILCTIDRASETIYYVNAGHNPAYVVRPDGVEQLASHGLPIGILPQTVYRTQSRRFPSHSLLVAYSDGITEAEDAAGEEFGNDRLEALLQDCVTLEPSEATRHIVSAVDRFTGETSQKDDQTMVIAKTS